jgi:hypothetical protein
LIIDHFFWIPMPASSPSLRWPLARVLAGGLTLGFLAVVLDVRGEHYDVLHEHWTAWIPIVYGGVMILPTLLAFFLWRFATRITLLAFCIPGLIVGPLGFYLHNRGHIGETFALVTRVWTDPNLDTSNPVPPRWAPLSIAGLSALGVLITLRRWDQPLTIPQTSPTEDSAPGIA